MQLIVHLPPEIPRLLLMRWEAIEYWERTLCERDRASLGDVRKAIGDLKAVLDGWRHPGDAAAGYAACKAAFDHVSKVSRRVGNDLATDRDDRTQNQLWRGRHIAHLLDGIEDESNCASAGADDTGSQLLATKEEHPAWRPDARNSCAVALRS